MTNTIYVISVRHDPLIYVDKDETNKKGKLEIQCKHQKIDQSFGIIIYTVRLLVPGHFYFYAVSKFSLRENDISVLLL